MVAFLVAYFYVLCASNLSQHWLTFNDNFKGSVSLVSCLII